MTPEVAAAVAAYHAELGRDPRAAGEQNETLRAEFARRGVTFDGQPMASFVRPHLVSRAAGTALARDGRRLVELAARVARAAFGGDAFALADWLGLPREHARWAALPAPPPDVVLSRADGFLTPQGPRFIELNSDAPAGFGYGDRMAEVIASLPVFAAVAVRHRLSYAPSAPLLVEAVLRQAPAGVASARVAIVDFAEVKTRPDQEILREAFAARGVDCVLADPREFELAAGRLVAGGAPVDVVYRRTVLSELLDHAADVQPFLRGCETGAAVLVNSFRCQLSEDKTLFALLTDDERAAELMDADERAFCLRVLPWTRKLEERRTRVPGGAERDLVAHAIEARERLVLKPAHGYGGRSVFVGDETDAAEWERAIREGLGASWVVQERVAIPEEPFPVWRDGGLAFESFKVNVNPFCVAGAEAGAVTRASRSSVINVSAGGGSVPTFVVG